MWVFVSIDFRLAAPRETAKATQRQPCETEVSVKHPKRYREADVRKDNAGRGERSGSRDFVTCSAHIGGTGTDGKRPR